MPRDSRVPTSPSRTVHLPIRRYRRRSEFRTCHRGRGSEPASWTRHSFWLGWETQLTWKTSQSPGRETGTVDEVPTTTSDPRLLHAARIFKALRLPEDTLERDIYNEREAYCWCRFDEKVHVAKPQSGSHEIVLGEDNRGGRHAVLLCWGWNAFSARTRQRPC